MMGKGAAVVTTISTNQIAQPGAATDLPATSLIICSRNRPQMLAETVASILEGDEVPTEIVVVDQSDTEHTTLGTLQTERHCTVRYIWTPTIGVGRARNLGITAAQHDLLAVTDDDMFAAPSWFGSLIRALVDTGPQGVVTGQVRPAKAEVAGGFVPSTKADETPAVYQGRIGKDVLYMGNMAMRRAAVDVTGFFDERLGPGTPFPGAEDNDFGFRLLEAGYRIIYVPQAVLYHRAWRSEREYLRLRWSYGVGRGAFYAKHLNLQDRYMLTRMLKDMKIHVVAFLHRFRHERRRAYGDALLALGILYGATRWLLTQQK